MHPFEDDVLRQLGFEPVADQPTKWRKGSVLLQVRPDKTADLWLHASPTSREVIAVGHALIIEQLQTMLARAGALQSQARPFLSH